MFAVVGGPAPVAPVTIGLLIDESTPFTSPAHAAAAAAQQNGVGAGEADVEGMMYDDQTHQFWRCTGSC